MDKLTIGADPEFFLKNKKTGRYVSAHDQVPGTKKEPYKLKCGGAVQADGTAVEFNIPPATTSKEFAESISDTISEIRGMVDKKFDFAFEPAVLYTPKYFESLPPEAKELGCEPDFSSIHGNQNVIKPLIKKYKTLRTGAGHIHIGWCKDVDIEDVVHQEDCKNLAYFLYKRAQRLLNRFELPNNRNRLYGGNGAYRVKPYGMEFRDPSNHWVGRPQLHEFIFNLFKKSVEMTQTPADYSTVRSYTSSLIYHEPDYACKLFEVDPLVLKSEKKGVYYG